MICNQCKQDKQCYLQPTFKQLIFGGFNQRMEYRCKTCERKVINKINKMLKKMQINKPTKPFGV